MVFDAETRFANIWWCVSSNDHPWDWEAWSISHFTPDSRPKWSETLYRMVARVPDLKTCIFPSFRAVLSHSISIHFFGSSKQTIAPKFQRETTVMADSGSLLEFMTKAQVWLWVSMNFPICFVAWTEVIARKLHSCAHIWVTQRNTSWICNLVS